MFIIIKNIMTYTKHENSDTMHECRKEREKLKYNYYLWYWSYILYIFLYRCGAEKRDSKTCCVVAEAEELKRAWAVASNLQDALKSSARSIQHTHSIQQIYTRIKRIFMVFWLQQQQQQQPNKNQACSHAHKINALYCVLQRKTSLARFIFSSSSLLLLYTYVYRV